MLNTVLVSTIQHLCSVVHKKFLGEYFMDKPMVTASINNNDLTKLKKLLNTYIDNALDHIEEFSPLLKYDRVQSTRNSIFMIGVNCNLDIFSSKKSLKKSCKEKVFPIQGLIVLQLAIWSSVSPIIFKFIRALLQNFRRKEIDINKMDPNEVWLWLHCYTTCVLSTTSCVYKRNANILETKNPLYQVLLLVDSIAQNTIPFIKFGINTSLSDMGIDTKKCSTVLKGTNLWTHMTHTFSKYLNGKLSNIQARSEDKKSLIFWSEVDQHDSCMNTFIKNFGTIMKEETNLNHFFYEKLFVTCQSEYTNSDELMHENHDHQQTNLNSTAIPVIPAKLKPISSELTSAFELPVITTDKFNKLLRHLKSLKKQMDKYGILEALGSNHHSLKDKKDYYKKCCDSFVDRAFSPADLDDSSYSDYVKKMVYFTGLVVHDILQTIPPRSTDLLGSTNIFAHVLSYCLFSSNGKSKLVFEWKKFFLKLIPRSAFIQESKSNQAYLAHYRSNCVNRMIILPLQKKQVEYYLENKYFPDINMIVTNKTQGDSAGAHDSEHDNAHGNVNVGVDSVSDLITGNVVGGKRLQDDLTPAKSNKKKKTDLSPCPSSSGKQTCTPPKATKSNKKKTKYLSPCRSSSGNRNSTPPKQTKSNKKNKIDLPCCSSVGKRISTPPKRYMEQEPKKQLKSK